MNRILVLLTVIFFISCDIAISTVLYCHGNQCYLQFSVSVSHYYFTVSVFDIWLTCILRCAISSGLVIAFLCNPLDTVTRTKHLASIPVFVSAILIIYTLIKLLAISEVDSKLSDPWCWGILSATIFFSVFVIINWWLISRVNFPQKLQLLVNYDEAGERKPLLQDSVKSHDKSDHLAAEMEKKRKKKGSILRLISLSRPDLFFIIVAFIFLTVSATGMLSKHILCHMTS